MVGLQQPTQPHTHCILFFSACFRSVYVRVCARRLIWKWSCKHAALASPLPDERSKLVKLEKGRPQPTHPPTRQHMCCTLKPQYTLHHSLSDFLFTSATLANIERCYRTTFFLLLHLLSPTVHFIFFAALFQSIYWVFVPLGDEPPVCLNCQVRPKVHIKCGVFQSLPSATRARSGALLALSLSTFELRPKDCCFVVLHCVSDRKTCRGWQEIWIIPLYRCVSLQVEASYLWVIAHFAGIYSGWICSCVFHLSTDADVCRRFLVF